MTPNLSKIRKQIRRGSGVSRTPPAVRNGDVVPFRERIETQSGSSTDATAGGPESWGASLASLIFPGTGQISQGRIARGITMLLVAYLVWKLMPLGPVVNIAAAVDAWRYRK